MPGKPADKVLAYAYHPEAEAEYLAEVAYYSQISEELGLRFVAELETAITRARQFPEAWAPIRGGLRRVMPRRFPRAIVDEIMEGRIFIWAVAHTSRRPGYWRERLGMQSAA